MCTVSSANYLAPNGALRNTSTWTITCASSTANPVTQTVSLRSASILTNSVTTTPTPVSIALARLSAAHDRYHQSQDLLDLLDTLKNRHSVSGFVGGS